MIVTIAYYAVLLPIFVYLTLYGGRTGVWGGSLQLLFALLSLLAVMVVRDKFLLHILMTSIDVVSLGWKCGLAVLSGRRWPVWVAGFQLNVVAAHVSLWFSPKWQPDLFYAMTTNWAIPTLLVMLIGTEMDRRYARKNAS